MQLPYFSPVLGEHGDFRTPIPVPRGERIQLPPKRSQKLEICRCRLLTSAHCLCRLYTLCV